jgi:hypothetical protein
MKIFVSGQITDLDNVRTVQRRLIDEGHEITHDWTRNETGDKMLAGDAAKLANIRETSRRAELDIQGVIDCDVYVVCTDNVKAGKGMYVELGAALALNVVTESPKIYALGALNHMSVFYFHRSVIRLSSVDELVATLNQQ